MCVVLCIRLAELWGLTAIIIICVLFSVSDWPNCEECVLFSVSDWLNCEDLKPNKNVLFSVSDWTVRTFRDVCIVLCSQTARTVRTYSHIIMYVCYFLYQSAWSVRQRRPRPCRKLWRKAFSQGNSSHREPLKWKNWNDILHLDCCTSLTALQVSGRNKQPQNRTKMCYQIIKTCVIRL